jgi:hypothetical protein
MKNIEKYLQGLLENIGQGMAKKIHILILGAAFLLPSLVAMPTMAAGASALTQLECIQWIAQTMGEQLPGSATASEYIQWATAKGMNPSGGWQPDTKLTRDVLAQILAQLFNLAENKNGRDYVRMLAREGIYLPDEQQITRADLARTFDDPVVIRQKGLKREASNRDRDKKKPDNDDRRPPPKDPKDRDDDRDHDGRKVTICHKGHTIRVSLNALRAHLAHGDTVGSCVVTEVQNR